MARAKFDPNNIVGDKIRYMSRRELCEFVGKLCALVRAEAGPGGVRGGIYPENISMDEKGELALGPAKDSDWEGQELQYAAPELYWNGKRSPASDVYSLGLLLYFGATRGKLPFDGECSDPQLRRMSGDEFPIPESAGRRLGEIIAKATSFKAADRYQSMEELGVLLDGCVTNLYLSGAPSAETIFHKDDDELNELERMMVGIIEKSDAAPLPEEIPEPETQEEQEEQEASEESAEPETSDETAEPEAPEQPSETDKPDEPETVPVPKKEAEAMPVVRLREEKNPELAPVVPAKPRTPAVQYTKNIEREKKIAEEVKKRRRRSVAVILVMCGALVVIAIVFNALLRDLNDVPTPDNNPSVTVAPGYVADYGTTDTDTQPDGSGDPFTELGGDEDDTPAIVGGENSNYEVIVEDASWTEAKARCEAKGGYLAVVTSQAELDKITALAQQQHIEMLWLGCHRENGELIWETGETVDFYPWSAGEPSLEDTGDNVSEDYLLLWYHNGAWVYNDSRNDPVEDYPQWYGGNIAYVCETPAEPQPATPQA